MTRSMLSFALGLVVLLAVACSAGSSASPSPTLGGTSWTVDSIGGAPVIATSTPTIAFAAGGTVSGTTGCNTYNGSYTVNGSSIKFGPLSMTQMACPDPVAAQERAFSLAISGATSWAIGSDGKLTLSGVAAIVSAPAAK